jgi:hypothetical protein
MATKRQRRKRRRRAEGGAAAPKEAAASPPPAPARTAARTDGPPQAPWGSFPLTELVVLVALVFLVLGFVVPPPRGAVLLGAGLALGSLGGLELAIREHFAGYKSHTLLLAGAIGVAVVAALYFLGPDSLAIWVCLLAGAVALGIATWFFAGAFRRRSGGALFKFRA